jgi:hypothetical protein
MAVNAGGCADLALWLKAAVIGIEAGSIASAG